MTKTRNLSAACCLAALLGGPALAGQAPGATTDPDIPISGRDRVYAAEQFSNTVSVIDPSRNVLLGVIRLGDPQPGNLSPLYRGQLLVHGMGVSPDGKTLAVVSIGSNAVTFIDTATSKVLHTTYVGRSPHEAAFTRDGKAVWVTVRGENYISVLDAATYQETGRIVLANGPGMAAFSPDGRYGFVCSSFTPELAVVDVASHDVVARLPQPSPFCPNIAVTPDGAQVWYTLKDVGKTIVIDARPPFATLATLDTGAITNHVNFVENAHGRFAYVTIGGLNAVAVFRRDDFKRVATIPVGQLPHGLWPSGDGKRVYVGLENGDRMLAIDTLDNKVIAETPIGQGPQALVYAPRAAAEGASDGLQPLALAGQAIHLTLGAPGASTAPTTVTLFDQGLTQVLQAGVTQLKPKTPYVLALSDSADGSGPTTVLSSFMTNPAGAAIVGALGPLKQPAADGPANRRYLVIREGAADAPGAVVQVQRP